ncbi:Eco57I restriction-modification methylase domain-containing protein [Nocardia sp. alder85J]|uniref:Eco57I restriction-modification methylase domain-containing protein n=1 Tax=Nocardia sp. alder85J TaxID=2862949 RepID=UPI001CD65E9E|nr:N-6 DNA methylase [Nocardia sp. alder85J]MCX4098617.1 methyltransferase domain-containing protein [Nocardia sp. alder85J]
MDGWGGPAVDRRAGRELGGAGARKRHGRHYTPDRLARFLADRLLAHLTPDGPLRILDPACGDGELLLAVRDAAAQRFPGLPVQATGYDLDPAAVRVARERAAALDAHWQVGDFLRAAAELAPDRFDVVITNPPYVRTQQLGAQTARLLRSRFGLSGRIDLTHPFVASVPRLLRPGGVLGLLCANRFLTTKAGANLRALLCGELIPVELYDLGDTKLFDAAVLPAVTIAVRPPPSLTRAETCRYVAAYESAPPRPGAAESVSCESSSGGPGSDRAPDSAESLGRIETSHGGMPFDAAGNSAAESTPDAGRPVDALPGAPETDDLFAALRAEQDTVIRHAGRVIAITVGTLDCGGAGSAAAARDSAAAGAPVPRRRGGVGTEGPPWRMSQPETDAWLRRVGAGTWRSFGELARIRVGIKTTADRVFISDRWHEWQPEPEAELLFDLLTHHDLTPWRITRSRPTRVLYPYDVGRTRRTTVDLAEYPCAAAYLDAHKQVLAARDYVVGGGREWFEIWVPQRPHLWRLPKLVFPDISVAPRFALDRSGAIVNGDCYWISLPDLGGPDAGTDRLAYLLMGVANSALGLRFYDAVCGNRLYSGRRRWITQYVGRLPVPDPFTPAAEALTGLVRDLVDGADPDPQLLDELVAAAFAVPGPR